MFKAFAVVAVAALLCGTAVVRLPGAAAGGCDLNWPMYQHDPGHSGSTTCSTISASNVSTLTPAWFLKTNSIVTDSPSVFNGMVYVGAADGMFYALDATSGAVKWTFSVISNPLHNDAHHASFGLFTSTAAIAAIPGGGSDPTVFFGGGATLYAVDAITGVGLWAQDLDPARPASGIEIESSPVIDTSTNPPEVLVGDDDNGGSGKDENGMHAFNALTGALLWKYEPELDSVVHSLTGQDGTGDACGDVWSSPALDAAFVDPGFVGTRQITSTGASSADGLVVFGTGNCSANPSPSTAAAHGDFALNAGIWGIDAVTGQRVWSFFEPPNIYDTGALNQPGNSDDDFGSSALLVHDGPRTLVIEGCKSGYVYAVDESTGALVWSTQDSQPGQLSPQEIGSIGGAIGSSAVGLVNGEPAVFLTSAIPLPFTDDGINLQTSYEIDCLGAELPLCPDLSILDSPTRIFGLHAVDAATGQILWQGPTVPTYAAVTYANGVVYAPATTGFSVVAYNANNGLPLWAFPLLAPPSSAVSISGASVFEGAGTQLENVDGQAFPPQLTGVWSFSVQTPTVAGVLALLTALL